MNASTKPIISVPPRPKVFISYSWTSTERKDWVLDLARRLMANGVDVIIDQWDLKHGQDKYAFMEQMVQDASIERVLMVCDKRYAENAGKARRQLPVCAMHSWLPPNAQGSTAGADHRECAKRATVNNPAPDCCSRSLGSFALSAGTQCYGSGDCCQRRIVIPLTVRARCR